MAPAKNPKGRAFPRKVRGSELVPACVDGLIIKGGRVLLEKRHSGVYGGYWGVPGGHLEPGESAKAGLAREVFEEIGLRVKVRELTGVYSGKRYTGSRTLSLCFLVKVVGRFYLRLQETEVDEARFFSPGRLPARMAFDHRKMVRDGFAVLSRKRKGPVVG